MSDLEKAVAKSFPGPKYNRRQMMLELKDGHMAMSGKTAKASKTIGVGSVQDAIKAIKKHI